MNYTAIVGALLALAVVATGAAAAAPGNAPVDAPTNETAQDEHADEAAEQADDVREAGAEPEQADDAAEARAEGQRGPPVDLPDQVPDFVGEIHDLVRQHISGALDGILGHQVADLTPDEESDAGPRSGPPGEAR